MRILLSDPEGIVSPNVDDVKRVASWLTGTDVEEAMRELADAEARFEAAKREVSGYKKKLARKLLD
jgi:hypothetical protein